MTRWSALIPIASLLLVAAAFVWPGQTVLIFAAGAGLIGSVLASVHHLVIFAAFLFLSLVP